MIAFVITANLRKVLCDCTFCNLERNWYNLRAVAVWLSWVGRAKLSLGLSLCHAGSDHCRAGEEQMINKVSAAVINGKWLMLVYPSMR